MVYEAKMRWRIELDYQDLKQDLGLGHCDGRGWRGFHHHASLRIAAYGFLLAQRLQHHDEIVGRKNSAQRQEPALPIHYKLRGSPPDPTRASRPRSRACECGLDSCWHKISRDVHARPAISALIQCFVSQRSCTLMPATMAATNTRAASEPALADTMAGPGQ